MKRQTAVLALAAGVATTLIVGVADHGSIAASDRVLRPRGLPVGIAAGLLVGAHVVLGLAGRRDRRIAMLRRPWALQG